MIVLDASAALASLFYAGPARAAVADEQVHVLHLIDSELANAIHRQVAARRLSATHGWSGLDTWRRLGVTRHPATPLLGRIWELRENLSAYDAGYVALAEGLSCSLITADAKLSRAPGLRCSVTVVPR